jgi:CRISPR/Cas system-associated protein Csm6
MGMDLHDKIQAVRGVNMARAAKRQLALPAALSKELDQLARREGKSALAVLQDLFSENKHNRLGQEYRAIQGYWSKKAKGILTARDLQRYLAKS